VRQVFEALARHASHRPNDIAFEDDTGQISWSDLASRVEGLAVRLERAEGAVGIGLTGGINYVVADLATTLSGKRQVPLPFFFSASQNAHIVMDAKIGTVITSNPGAFAALAHLRLMSPASQEQGRGALRTYPGGAERVIYTSGSSGTPKGVVIGDRQLDASVSALSRIVEVAPSDTHLSVLPLAQLLEQICGIFLPIIGGARTVFRFAATQALFGAPIEPLGAAFAEVRPTTSLLAPAVLARWPAALQARGQRAPDSLRFVAVGGAATAPSVIAAALDAQIPVHEGYGLSECCAVVAMNPPGDNRPGTVGKVLDGVEVALDQGEITVSGQTVMTGYLNGDAAPRIWRTGDLGHFEDGRLVVDGRKDALLVTGAGRNISPEWVEQRVNADPRVTASALGMRTRDGALVLIVAASAPISLLEIARLLADLPDYAKPCAAILVDPSEPGLLFPVGTPNRSVAARLIDEAKALSFRAHTESIAS
jgi:long-subunit acyl-CoA synthetase (AMP-forming)